MATIVAASRPLAEPFKSQVLTLLTDKTSTLTSSMYRDMRGGTPVEADQIVGDLVRWAAAKGVPTPLLSAVLVRLQVYEALQDRK